MFAEEWPLLLFTLLTQLAVGLYLFFVIVRSFNEKLGNNAGLKLTKLGMFVIGPITAVALLLSVFHLGDPLGAYRAILNVDSSWLSREILFTGSFFGLWIVSYILERQGKWNQILGWVTSIVGLGAVFCMASIYATSIKPAWTDINTYVAFFGTTILFGAVTSMAFLLLSKEEKPEYLTTIIKSFGLVGLGAIIVQLVYMPVYLSGLTTSGAAGLESVGILTSSYTIATIIRWILSILGLTIIGYLFYKNRSDKKQISYYMTAVVLVLAGEFLGRYIFYATGVSIIVG